VFLGRTAAAASLLLLASCGHVVNLPINQPVADANAGLGLADVLRPSPAWEDDILVGLAFSGGGMRAAAFSFGVLKEMEKANVSVRGERVPLIDHIDFVTGVSGGAVPAAYFGLKRRAGWRIFASAFSSVTPRSR
jgi:NTE family protein